MHTDMPPHLCLSRESTSLSISAVCPPENGEDEAAKIKGTQACACIHHMSMSPLRSTTSAPVQWRPLHPLVYAHVLPAVLLNARHMPTR